MLKEKPVAADGNEYEYSGVDISCTDGGGPPPVVTPLDRESAHEWFQTYPEKIECPAIRLLVCRKKTPFTSLPDPDQVFGAEAVDHAFWKPELYRDMACRASGGCAAMIDEPYRFMLQTPRDGLPFASLAMSRRGNICKGIYTHDDAIFEPRRLIAGESIHSGGRGDGVQIVNLPQGLLRASSAWISGQLADVVERVADMERALTDPLVDDFSGLLRALHACHDRTISMERRAGFERLVADSVLEVVGHSRWGNRAGGQWSPLAPWEAARKMRATDLQAIPRRIENARAAVNDSVFQRTQVQSLAIARSTQRIAEATMKDSASMMAIAVMTMIFLPGTAVASFFSMTMWNWEIPSGTLVSHWIWIYFVVAIPMTVVVLAIWWVLKRKREKALDAAVRDEPSGQVLPPYTRSRRYGEKMD